MSANTSRSRLLKIILSWIGISIAILIFMTENHEWLQSLSLSIIAGLRGVQVPTNFVNCAFYNPEVSLGSGALFHNTAAHDALFNRICGLGIGPFKFLPALVYALVGGFTSGFWGILISTLLCLFCLAIVQDFRKGRIGFVELLFQFALAVLIVWLISVFIVWVFEAVSALLGVLATFSTFIAATVIVRSIFSLRRELREGHSALEEAVEVAEHKG